MIENENRGFGCMGWRKGEGDDGGQRGEDRPQTILGKRRDGIEGVKVHGSEEKKEKKRHTTRTARSKTSSILKIVVLFQTYQGPIDLFSPLHSPPRFLPRPVSMSISISMLMSLAFPAHFLHAPRLDPFPACLPALPPNHPILAN